MDIKLKYGLRAMMVYEGITDKPFEIDKTYKSWVTLVYSMAYAGGSNISFDEFIDYADNHPAEWAALSRQATELLESYSKLAEALPQHDSEADKKKE